MEGTCIFLGTFPSVLIFDIVALYSCYYVRPLWCIVNTVFGVIVKYYQILGLDRDFKYDAIVKNCVFSYIRNRYCYLLLIKVEIQQMYWIVFKK